MAGRFLLFFDACVRQQVIDGLKRRGWSVQRAIDALLEGTKDSILFEHVAKTKRVLVANDEGIQAIGERWLREGGPFRMITWQRKQYRRMTDGESIGEIEERAETEDPFAYPIVYIKPKY